jgi:hypothetical protein
LYEYNVVAGHAFAFPVNLDGEVGAMKKYRPTVKYLIALVVLTLIYTFGLSILTVHGGQASSVSISRWYYGFALVLIAWVRADRRVHEFQSPFEFDVFLFFAWPVVVPYYLYRTRGGRGLLLGFVESAATVPRPRISSSEALRRSVHLAGGTVRASAAAFGFPRVAWGAGAVGAGRTVSKTRSAGDTGAMKKPPKWKPVGSMPRKRR